ncbi:universal stress protein [Streptomyces subrutilus]|nr:hypothetical protein GCM10010371_70130 [Streptomyces subrutilus]
MANPVTVGLDGSRESVTAACWAAREADLLGTRLERVQVQEEPGRPARPLLRVASTEVQRRWTEGLLHEARDEVRRLYPDREVTSRIGPITHAVLHHAAAPVAVVAHE